MKLFNKEPDDPVDVEVVALTPKGKEKSSKLMLESSLLGAIKQPKSRKIGRGKITWVITCKNHKELTKLTYRAAKSDISIKKFYSFLFKIIRRGNKMCNKGEKGIKKARNWFKKQLLKQKNEELAAKVEGMSDQEFKEYLKVEDRAYMEKFLKKDLVTARRLEK